MSGERIDLGLAVPVRLGRLLLEPAVRVIRRDDGSEDVVEPRVMQVLLALAEQPGHVVRREDLTERCWEGRVVGEDAINRVLSRLRRVAEGIGADSFRIETITKVGYRLIVLGEGASIAPTPAPAAPARPTRRNLLLIGGLGMIGATGSGIALWRKHAHKLPPAAKDAMDRGLAALRMGTPDQLATAIVAFREAADAAPDRAEPLGLLSVAYRVLSDISHGQEAALNADRAREAAGKALKIDPDNVEALITLAALHPLFRNWLKFEAAVAPIAARHPESISAQMMYMGLLAEVGRVREVNVLAQRLLEMQAKEHPFESNYISLSASSWCLNRLDDADSAIDRAFHIWPRQPGIWFTRQRLLSYTGRAAQALAMIEDIDHRPINLPQWDFDLAHAESQALLTRSKADIDAAAALYWPQIHKAVGPAQNAIQFFTAVGRLDDAIAVTNALYFDRGFSVGDRNFSDEGGSYVSRGNRPTWVFWFPFMAPLRADPRLRAIFQEIGLIDYWRKSGHKPDVPVLGVT